MTGTKTPLKIVPTHRNTSFGKTVSNLPANTPAPPKPKLLDQLREALDRKHPNAPADWRWQWVFPQENRWKDPQSGDQGRHHID